MQLYERENELLYDLAKKQVYSLKELESMNIGDFYSYLAKELKDSSELIKKTKKDGNRN